MRFIEMNITVFFVKRFFEKKISRLGLESGQYFYPFSSGKALIWSVCSIVLVWTSIKNDFNWTFYEEKNNIL